MYECIVLLLESLLCWWAELRTMLRHLDRRGLNGITWALLTVYNLQRIIYIDAVVCQNNGQFQVWELNSWQFIVIVEIKYFLNLNEYYLPIFILSIHFRQIFVFLKSPKTFRVIITIILCCPCYMPKYVPRLEGIMHFPSGHALCLLTLGLISAYNMDNTILYKQHPIWGHAR